MISYYCDLISHYSDQLLNCSEFEVRKLLVDIINFYHGCLISELDSLMKENQEY